jgi:hypothetical protein
MDAASKLGAARAGYASPREIARARARNGARFDLASSSATQSPAKAPAASEPPRSTHATRSAAQIVLLEAQAVAIPAFERLPAALRARAPHPTDDGTDFEASAEALLDGLRAMTSPAPQRPSPPDAVASAPEDASGETG